MFIDTSGFFLLLDTGHARHPESVAAVHQGQKLFTHAYVLAELVPLAQSRSLPRTRVLMFISALLESSKYEVVWVDQKLRRQAHELLLARTDKKYSLCDAVSFVLMRERDEQEALTTDHHFEQEGFVRLLP